METLIYKNHTEHSPHIPAWLLPSVFLLVSIPLKCHSTPVPFFLAHFRPWNLIPSSFWFQCEQNLSSVFIFFSLWCYPHTAWCSFFLLFSVSIFKILYAPFFIASLSTNLAWNHHPTAMISKFNLPYIPLFFPGHSNHKTEAKLNTCKHHNCEFFNCLSSHLSDS